MLGKISSFDFIWFCAFCTLIDISFNLFFKFFLETRNTIFVFPILKSSTMFLLIFLTKVRKLRTEEPQISICKNYFTLLLLQSVSFADPPVDPAPSGSNPLVKFVRGMWASREMLNESTDPQIVMRTTLRELIVYR